MELVLSINYNNLLTKVRRNLAVIGKRAKTVTGESMYSDIMTSSNEESLLSDVIDAGAQNIVAELADLTAYYAHRGGTIVFTIVNSRWTTEEGALDYDITEALTDAISEYLYNYCLQQYLSDIHPSTGAKYPPLYGTTYAAVCQTIMLNIRRMAFAKRPADVGKTISQITSEILP